jgi:hypothetical protein
MLDLRSHMTDWTGNALDLLSHMTIGRFRFSFTIHFPLLKGKQL